MLRRVGTEIVFRRLTTLNTFSAGRQTTIVLSQSLSPFVSAPQDVPSSSFSTLQTHRADSSFRTSPISSHMRSFSTETPPPAAEAPAVKTPEQLKLEEAEQTAQKLKNEVAELKKQITAFEEEKKEMQDWMLRYKAEAENARKIAHRDVENAKKYGITNFAKSLLDVNDNLKLAIENTPTHLVSGDHVDKPLKDLYEGVAMTRRILLGIFETNLIEEYDPMNQPFDPDLHEALFQIPFQEGGPAPNTVTSVVRTGYKIHDRIIRVAKVGVVPKH
eukprot:TRINITY_DN3515_c0_g1_i1.p1 TRINITY_DN3515_c0_g1~~TRINITY_DN3515_c0_g1_i1.p1  ORF type:complete len:318 (-),score=148.87 TRINITY_DN3515_c0_g1_i1:249-1070(-)